MLCGPPPDGVQSLGCIGLGGRRAKLPGNCQPAVAHEGVAEGTRFHRVYDHDLYWVQSTRLGAGSAGLSRAMQRVGERVERPWTGHPGWGRAARVRIVERRELDDLVVRQHVGGGMLLQRSAKLGFLHTNAVKPVHCLVRARPAARAGASKRSSREEKYTGLRPLMFFGIEPRRPNQSIMGITISSLLCLCLLFFVGARRHSSGQR